MNLKQITDMDLIVFLVAKGFKIEEINKQEKKTIFYFKETEEFKSSIIAFVNKSECINIGDILGAKRRVKTLLCT